MRYSINLPDGLEADLKAVSTTLGIRKSETIRRALLLFKHAVAADKVELTLNDERQTVLLK